MVGDHVRIIYRGHVYPFASMLLLDVRQVCFLSMCRRSLLIDNLSHDIYVSFEH